MNRKLFSLLVALVVATGLALAQQEHPTGPQEHPKGMQAKGGPPRHKVAAEFVSVDADAKTITIKDEKGETFSPPILNDKALAFAKNLKAGEKIVLICRDTPEGKHEGVAGIKMAKAPAEKKM